MATKKILLSGGGTLGSVTPLLALVPELRARGAEVLFVGTVGGPERQLVEQLGVPFYSITATRLPRYITGRWLLIPFQFAAAKWEAFWLLRRLRPDVIVSAGGFVSVPLVWMGWLLRVPALIHQQDVQPGLSTRLMQPFARNITVAFEDSLRRFPKSKTQWIGNPVRDLTPTTHIMTTDKKFPTVMIFGGGTGARAINQLVTAELCECANVIHLTGKGRDVASFTHPRYHPYEFLAEEMKEALAKADVVVARAGIGSISELAALGKPSIIIPMPGTHQERNAAFVEQHQAAVILDQRTIDVASFTHAIQQLLQNRTAQEQLADAIHALHKSDAQHRLIQLLIQR